MGSNSTAASVGLLLAMLGSLAACGDDAFTELLPQPEPVPPPLSGGTLLISRDDSTVVAADADRNAVWLIDAASQSVRNRVQLPLGSEPGRLIEASDGKIYVVLRRSGQLARIDVGRARVEGLLSVCPAPRGLAHRADSDELYVACASGELVTVDAQHGTLLRSQFIDSDLRDVVLWGDHLLVSRFRSAELIEVSATGAVMTRSRPHDATTISTDALGNNPKTHRSSPTTAWRMLAMAGGDALVLHQRALDDTIAVPRDAYRDGLCSAAGIVTASLTIVPRSGSPPSPGPGATLRAHPVTLDVAVSSDGKKLALIESSDFSAESVRFVPRPPYRPIWAVNRTELTSTGCLTPMESPGQREWHDTAIAGAYDKKDQLWIQTVSARVYRVSDQPPVPMALTGAEPVDDSGRKLFYEATRSAIACVSCHPDGRDDAHVWKFEGIGDRRTQSLHGGLLQTAPFHWNGDLADLGALTAEVFTKRMGGGQLQPAQVEALGRWLDQQPPLPKTAPAVPSAVERGKQLFFDPTVGCATCHDGPQLTNSKTVDVGTGKAFQVPSLLDVGSRAPYMHDGCAATLEVRFNSTCGGGDRHGRTSQLDDAELSDLVAYLRTL